ncbi:MAG TPA: hypothetical protein VGD21_06775 [Lysobacter sp.]
MSRLLVLLLLATTGHGVRAAESYANCTGFVDSVPAVITAAGTWCLRHDLASTATSGNAISIQADNVVLDCNGFKLGGLGAGASTNATGIQGGGSIGSGGSQYNVTVRNCTVRGFGTGISIIPGSGNGSGYLVEDNLLDQNRSAGILIGGGRNRVQRNRVINTGGRPGGDSAFGIRASADLIDNIVDGIAGDADQVNFSAYGIDMGGEGYQARGNQVSGLHNKGSGAAFGLLAGGSNVLSHNRIVAPVAVTAGAGICGYQGGCVCIGNTVANFSNPFSTCVNPADNASH